MSDARRGGHSRTAGHGPFFFEGLIHSSPPKKDITINAWKPLKVISVGFDQIISGILFVYSFCPAENDGHFEDQGWRQVKADPRMTGILTDVLTGAW